MYFSGEITKDSSESVAGLSIKEDLLITGASLKAHSLSRAGVLVSSPWVLFVWVCTLYFNKTR